MRLAQFISASSNRIIAEWEKFAATRLPAASSMTAEQQRDHIAQMLRRIMKDLDTAQTDLEQAEKSKGKSDATSKEVTAATSHGSERAGSGYTPEQMISEFRALRASVLRLWLEEVDHFDRAMFDEATRFNEAVDQALAESLRSYTLEVDHAKDLLLGVLGHDLRSPLGAIILGATMLLTESGPDWPHAKTASRILNSGSRMEAIVRDLLDFTRGKLGGGIPVVRAEMDLEPLLQQSVDEIGAFHPRCTIELESPGPVVGVWDRDRLGQVLANLIGNACQHGGDGLKVHVTLGADEEAATIAVRNGGATIPAEFLADIFEPFRRLAPTTTRKSDSVGLGLYIVKALVTAHEGTIAVTSSEGSTTFSVRLPRRPGSEASPTG